MEKTSTNKQLLKELQAQLKNLQAELVAANKLEGIDAYITVNVDTNQARFQRIKKKDAEDKAVGNFLLELLVTAKQQPIFIPLSIASGKKPTGFIYQIEGTAEGVLAGATITCRGDTVTQVTVGTLLYAKIPTRETASFRIQASIRGKFGKTYKIIISRINYKLTLSDARYQQYLKEIISDTIKFS
jgi:hypothetical protein